MKEENVKVANATEEVKTTEVNNAEADNSQTPQNPQNPQTRVIKTQEQIVKDLIKNGAKFHKGLTVKNVNFEIMPDHTRFALTLNEYVPAYLTVNDERTLDISNVIFVSAYQLIAILKNDETTARISNKLLAKPELLANIMNYAKIDIVQEHISANTEYISPFTTQLAPEAKVYDHDIIINNVTNITLSDFVQQTLNESAKAALMNALMLD